MKVTDTHVTKKEAAKLLKVNQPTIWRLIQRGDLPAERVGQLLFIRRSDLAELRVIKAKGGPNGNRVKVRMDIR